ncbi:transcriptional regulator family: Fungal Specific TF [Paecilomyces variotii]|nr:transcriptional regulator family: Fungal Specific TF [Paecilomyces variotii]
MELTWLADTPQSRRRSRAAKACSNCQRKKKRCRHLSTSFTGSSNIRRRAEHGGPIPSSQVGDSSRVAGDQQLDSVAEVMHHRPSHSDISTTHSALPRSTRFVGDLNPEAVLLGKLDEASQVRRNRIGLWVSPSDRQDEERNIPSSVTTASRSLEPFARSPLDKGSVFLSLHQRYLAAIESCQPLPASTQEHLVSIYFSKINSILPLLEEDLFLRDCRNANVSVLLVRAMCLVAAKNGAARSHLRLKDTGPCLTPREFCSELYKGLASAVSFEVEADRISRIQILALLSLHCEGFEGAETASMHLCHALHQAQTVGLHLSHPGRAVDDHLARLFWCLWSLDKLHASIGGRPILMADRDIGIDKPSTKGSGRHSAFGVWLDTADLLASVISLYRPSLHSDPAWEGDFPSFENVMGNGLRDHLNSATVGLLELFYHAVSILSCRSGSSGPGPSRSSLTRRDTSAACICSIMASDWARELPPLPIVPYAISLSMSVSYQQLRQGDSDIPFDRAKNNMEFCCSFLEELSMYWDSANAMFRLGRRALKQIEDARARPYEATAHQSRVPLVPSSRRHVVHDEVLSETTKPTTPEQEADHVATDLNIEDPSSGRTDLAPTGGPSSLDEGFDRGNFEDIDTLFGEYLDLSLPTNFWDPMFMVEENT